MAKQFWCAVALIGLSGCLMQNLSPETRMRDAVIELNEGARWGRMDVASGHVAPQFRPQFKLSHIHWGRDIQIADTEILGMSPETDEEGVGAFSRVAVRWYDESTMVLASTVIRQTWQKHKQTFLLTNESIESGHPGLLMIPEEQPSQPSESDSEPSQRDTFTDDSQWSSVY
ncbi:MAG TPA: hypothetical protein VLS88_18130 [Polyangiales bacterium]|jgi:hypothetical protein|nr:hypothetical protein [Polyangiales bacterium]